jgi:MFS family permease
VAHFTRAFRHRNYQLFFAGQLISLTGTWMQSVAESWLVFRLTGSAALLGVTSFCTLAPVFLFATFGGILADRVDRRRILIATQSLSMVLPLTLAVLTLSGHVRVWHVFVLATCLASSTPSTFRRASRSSSRWSGARISPMRSRSTRRWSTAPASSDRRSPGCWWRQSAKAGAS